MTTIPPPRLSRFGKWSLRKRLLMVTIALFMALTLAVVLASILVMRSVLLLRLDDQLRDFGSRVQSQTITAMQTGGTSITVDPRGGPGAIALLRADDRLVFGYYVSGDNTGEKLTDAQVRRLTSVTSDPWQPGTASLDVRGDYRVMQVPVVANNDQVQLYVALPMADMNQTMLALTMVIATSAIAAGTLLVALADVIIRRAMRPLTAVVATTERISQLPLDAGEVNMSNRVYFDDPATEVGRVGESVNRMLNHLESALEARAASEDRMRQFVADASHELRTPLAAVKGYAEITRKHERDMSEDARTALQRIESAADRMSALVQDLLLLARLDEGREVNLTELDFSMLVVEAVADAQAAGPEHPVSLDLPGDPVLVQADPLRIQQVVANLLTNARVHTPAGTRVHVALAREGTDARLTVADEGPGLDPRTREHIFERFVRGDASRSRAAGSSGLGLAIVQAIVDAHGGSIVASERPGGGAQFTVRLPLAAADGASPHPSPSEP